MRSLTFLLEVIYLFIVKEVAEIARNLYYPNSIVRRIQCHQKYDFNSTAINNSEQEKENELSHCM